MASRRNNREILEAVDELNAAADASPMRLTRLNLRGARIARALGEHARALDYLSNILKRIMPPGADAPPARRFLFSIRDEQARNEFALGHFSRARAIAVVLVAFAREPEQKARALILVQILQLNRGRLEESIQTGRRALKLMNVNLGHDDAISRAARREWYAVRSPAATKEAPRPSRMINSSENPAMEIMMHMLPAAAQVDPNLRMLLAARMCNTGANSGGHAASAAAYVHLAAVRASRFNDFETAHQDGLFALETVMDPESSRRVTYAFAAGINHWRRPLRTNLKLLESVSHPRGEPLFEVLAARDLTRDMFICSESLEKVLIQCGRSIKKARDMGFLGIAQAQHDLADMLRGLIDEAPPDSRDRTFESDAGPEVVTDMAISESTFSKIHAMRHAHLMGESEKALLISRTITHADSRTAGSTALPEYYLYYSLTLAAAYDSAGDGLREEILREIPENQKRLLDWAVHCPENFQHAYLLCEAEYARITDRRREAVYLYDQAIRSARDAGFTNIEALASETAARFYMTEGDSKNARTRVRDARYAYLQWGARSLVRSLEKEFSELLGPGGGDALDFTAILEASRALSGEIRLEQLPARLLFLAMENVGGRLGFLLLRENDEEPRVVVRGTSEGGTVQLERPMALHDAAEVPASVIQHVMRVRGGMVLRDARTDQRFRNELRLMEGAARSVICAPIAYHGELTGIIYLEDNREGFSFDNRRLDVLEILCSQAAISLQNARLYSRTSDLNRELREEITERVGAENRIRALNNRLEQRVRERTRDLEAANHELQETLEKLRDTQKDLIESEKMAALGELTAGFAHEINTPLGVALTAASFLEQFVKKNPVNEADGRKFREKIAESSGLILSNVERAADLIGNFKQTAVDKTMGVFHLVEHLEQVAAKLAPVLGAGEHKLRILGDRDLKMEGSAAELEQVAVNLIMNSVTHAFEPGERGQLRFDVMERKNRMYLVYSDDGRGIPEHVRPRIFEPFFTTRRGRDGTGLGLHIVYNIITGKLGGRIRCESRPGETVFLMDWPVDG